uniref:Uncharacterized protein n=1 Tax=Nelumbo nucifera TaxID=4432 RepID=A0A822YRE7_NELNU|nr:TPA_asm: hypothetical protein HUJ06_005353 [Nelumbo nucifera]
MALNLSKHAFPLVFEFSSLSIEITNPKYREASVTTLGVISKRCFELMKDKLLEPIILTFSWCLLKMGTFTSQGFGGVSSDDDAHDEPRLRNICIRTGVLDEKVATTHALELFALHTYCRLWTHNLYQEF